VVAKHQLDPSKVFLEGVAAVSPTDVWAVGAVGTTIAGYGSITVGLIEHYDGRVWCAVDTHDWTGNFLYAVAALSARDVWAVGDQIEHWDGRAWTVVPSAPTIEGSPMSLSASSPSNVWASNGGFVERWDGRHWQGVPLPIQDRVSPGSVATFSATDTWLVGTSTGYGPGPRAVHWDGQRWQAMLLPRGPAPASYGRDLRATCTVPNPMSLDLPAVAAVAQDNVWAVGYQTSEDGQRVCPLAFHWDGAHWHEVWIASSAQDVQFLARTYADAAWQEGWPLSVATGVPGGAIWALTDPAIFALHFDGHAWHTVTAFTGPKNAQGLVLTAMSASSDDDVWAVTNEPASPWNAYHWDGKTWRGVAAIPAG